MEDNIRSVLHHIKNDRLKAAKGFKKCLSCCKVTYLGVALMWPSSISLERIMHVILL